MATKALGPDYELRRKMAIKQLQEIPGVGISIATDLWDIGITSVNDLKGKDPGMLYERSNTFADAVQDRCLLYVFRCAVYYADTKPEKRDPEKLKWWYWKDRPYKREALS